MKPTRHSLVLAAPGPPGRYMNDKVVLGHKELVLVVAWSQLLHSFLSTPSECQPLAMGGAPSLSLQAQSVAHMSSQFPEEGLWGRWA